MKTSVLLGQVALILFVNHPVNVNIMQFRGDAFIAAILWWWYWVQPTMNAGKKLEICVSVCIIMRFFGCTSNKSLELVDLGQHLFLGYGVLVFRLELCEEEAWIGRAPGCSIPCITPSVTHAYVHTHTFPGVTWEVFLGMSCQKSRGVGVWGLWEPSCSTLLSADQWHGIFNKQRQACRYAGFTHKVQAHSKLNWCTMEVWCVCTLTVWFPPPSLISHPHKRGRDLIHNCMSQLLKRECENSLFQMDFFW